MSVLWKKSAHDLFFISRVASKPPTAIMKLFRLAMNNLQLLVLGGLHLRLYEAPPGTAA
jgi:hypothetical protein